MDDVAPVAEDLHLDVPRAFDQLLDIEPAIAEGGECFRLRLRHQMMEFLGRTRDADAASAAAGRGLDHHGKAGRLDQCEGCVGRFQRVRRCRGRSARRPQPQPRRAATLSPISRIDCAVGPTKISPAASTAAANSAFSARKP